MTWSDSLPFLPGAAEAQIVAIEKVAGVLSGELSPLANLGQLTHPVSLSGTPGSRTFGHEIDHAQWPIASDHHVARGHRSVPFSTDFESSFLAYKSDAKSIVWHRGPHVPKSEAFEKSELVKSRLFEFSE